MYLLERLTERSTWIGITAVISGAGISIAPELTNSVISMGMGVAGIISMVTRDQAE